MDIQGGRGGSCHWSLRSLVMAFYVDTHIDLFEAEMEKLPVEKGDFEIVHRVIHWKIMGYQESGKIVLELLDNQPDANYALDDYNTYDAFLETLWQYQHRPNNKKALYKNRFYTNENTLFLNAR